MGADAKLINVLHDSPTYSEIIACYKHDSILNPWIRCIMVDEFLQLVANESSYFYTDQKAIFVLWANNIILDKPRKSRVVMRYCELVGNDIPIEHIKMLEKVRQIHNGYDAIVTHSNASANFLISYLNRHVFTIPIGYNGDVMGRPNFTSNKNYDVVFYGGVRRENRRVAILPKLAELLRHRFNYNTTKYWPYRQPFLDSSRAILHLSQIKGGMFETMRLWQAIASSAVLFIEPKDTFPAIPNKHFIEIPFITIDNVVEISGLIQYHLDNTDLLAISKQAHNDLSKYTTFKCLNDLLAALV